MWLTFLVTKFIFRMIVFLNSLLTCGYFVQCQKELEMSYLDKLQNSQNQNEISSSNTNTLKERKYKVV